MDCSASVTGYKNNNYQSFTSEDKAWAFLSLNRPTPQPVADESDLDTPGYYGPSIDTAPSRSLPTFSNVARLSYVPPPSTLPTTTATLTCLPPAYYDCSSLSTDDLLRICPSASQWRLHQLMDQQSSLSHLRLVVSAWLADPAQTDSH